jgi:hypothetical protein
MTGWLLVVLVVAIVMAVRNYHYPTGFSILLNVVLVEVGLVKSSIILTTYLLVLVTWKSFNRLICPHQRMV